MRFGPRWDAVAEAWRDGDEVAGRLVLPEQYRCELDAWSAHPALVDVATTFGMVLGDHDDCLYIPISYDRVTSRGSLPAKSWARVRRVGTPSKDVLRLDLSLGDDDGNVLLTIEGLALRPVAGSETLVRPEPSAISTPEHGHRVPPLLAVAEQHGIVADEGVEMLERLLASDHCRLISSSIEFADVMRLVVPATPTRLEAVPDAAHPQSRSVLSTIHGIWVELLGVPDIGVDEDFFDAGGHSLIAIRMLSRVHKELGVRFELTTIFDAPTISALADEVRKARPDLDLELAGARDAQPGTQPVSPRRSLVPISTTGEKRPIFVVHGAGGNVLFLWTLARALGGSRPVYGFQAHGVDGGDMPDPSIGRRSRGRRRLQDRLRQHGAPLSRSRAGEARAAEAREGIRGARCRDPEAVEAGARPAGGAREGRRHDVGIRPPEQGTRPRQSLA
jgi:acyl carrier protein